MLALEGTLRALKVFFTRYQFYNIFRHTTPAIIREGKGKVKFRCGALFSTGALSAYCTLDPKGVHSSLQALHAKRRERPQLAKEGAIVGI
jgi:hypothetical protein